MNGTGRQRRRANRTGGNAARAGLAVLSVLAGLFPARAADPGAAVALPDGVRAVWDLGGSHRATTATRERVSLNGLWRWQPETDPAGQPPAGSWGYFKAPGSWPGISDYMQKDAQTVFAHPDWKDVDMAALSGAWYEREFTVPEEWDGRRIVLQLDCLNSFAVVYLDGRRIGEARFPAGEVDLSGVCRAGGAYRLSLLVRALPLQEVLEAYTDSAAARTVRGSVARRGLCGDVSLVGTPRGPRLAAVRTEPSVRNRELRVVAALQGLAGGEGHRLRVRVRRAGSGAGVPEFVSPAFSARDLDEEGRWSFAAPWMPEDLWDVHTPENVCDVEVGLLDAGGKELDVFWPQRTGFREFWIEGRDFYLNGSRIHLSAVPLDNAQVSAALSTYEAARESLERLRAIGINFVYTHNYGCEPGAHLAFGEILRAADDVGMLVALSQPHFSAYEWEDAAADAANGYAGHAAYYTAVAGNHPSVVCYATSHNATGYNEDMNPDLIGIREVRDEWAARNVRKALRAEAIIRRLDPSRIIYHHASGDLGPMHPVNFYPNFVPIQEMSDWFGPWAAEGVKPVFLCEYAAPFSWDWTMYRGWYAGQREFGSAAVPWEFCLAEWNAQFLGDAAYPASAAEQENLRWEARQFRAGKTWRRWDYPNPVGSDRFAERYPVFAAYLTDNWRAFRTWGVSAISPWEYGHFWTLRSGVDRGRRDLEVDWDRLQRPGFSPDYLDQRYERMDLAYERSDWIATPAAEAVLRNNRPLLAWIAGPEDRFTAKDHLFLPGETVEKQIVVVNDSRETVRAEVDWSVDLSPPLTGRSGLIIPTGEQGRLPFRIPLPIDVTPGSYAIDAVVRFETGESQVDRFVLEVLPPPEPAPVAGRIGLFDPPGETAAELERLAVPVERVEAAAGLEGLDLLIVGRRALAPDQPAPAIGRVREGLKVLVFEQTAETLERRFGFRVAEYGLRRAFARIPDHPVFAGLGGDFLRDWRGEATLLAPRLDYEPDPRFNGAPTVRWCGLPVPRLWRCGNRGNVASVLIEKPACGDFLPLLDGGYSLQYSPLLEFREGQGMVLFCQLDVTGRSARDPAADHLLRRIVRYAAGWKPAPRRQVVYAGEPGGRAHLEVAGFAPAAADPGALPADALLVVGPGGGGELESHTDAVAAWRRAGGAMLAVGLDAGDLAALPPPRVTVRRGEHLSTGFAPAAARSLLAGVGPADVHNRDPREVPLVVAGAERLGNGALAWQDGTVFCQLAPWRFAEPETLHLKRTRRRLSVLLARLLGNLGAASQTPLLERFARPVDPAAGEERWRQGFYLDQPEEWDDPYRFFRW